MGKHPDDEARCVLAVSKSNIGPKPLALTYRIESVQMEMAIETSRITWEGPSDHTAADLVSTPMDSETRSQVDNAAEFLLERLADGPAPVNEIKEEARRNGIPEKTLQRAKGKIGVAAKKDGMRGGWIWCLPNRDPEDGQSGPKMALQNGMTTFGEFDHLRDGPAEDGQEEPKMVNQIGMATFGEVDHLHDPMKGWTCDRGDRHAG